MNEPMTPRPKLKDIKRKSVSLPQGELVTTAPLNPGQPLPLLISPAVEGIDLADWVAYNRELVESYVISHGAVLFRGFNISSIPAFERFAHAVCPSGLFEENGEHPRESLSGSVYTPVFFAPEKKLLWHNENSFNHSWPKKIMFGCIRPAAQGGETPIVDSREVYKRIDPLIRERFVQRQVAYVRNYGDNLGLDWRTVFRTNKRAEVEAYCRDNRIEYEWKPNGSLRTVAVRPAVIPHPQTGELSWFNQAQHWHIACLDPEVRESLMAAFQEQDLPRACYYGDGSPIEDAVMREILELYQELEVSYPWQQGDVIVIDNVLAAHGRNPFQGERKLLVALGEMCSFDERSLQIGSGEV